jgi:hypothetical protein
MKIEIVLKDPKYCNGCPILETEASVGGCRWIKNGEWLKVKETSRGFGNGYNYSRPAECRERYGD